MEKRLERCAEIPAKNTTTDYSWNAPRSMDVRLLVTILEMVALEKLISARQVVVRELHSEQFPVLNEFEALYSYKCGLLENCLGICRQNVNRLLRAGSPRYQHYLILMPEFLSILDGEVLSLFGIIRLLRPVLFALALEFACGESISLLTLSVYLMVQCQKKLRSDSVCDTVQLIRVVYDKVFLPSQNEAICDRLILKLLYRSLKLYLDGFTSAI